MLMTKTLAGLTLLNTRPKAQAQHLIDFVHQHGGNTVSCPAIEIEPLKPDWGDTIPSRTHWVIFISQNAVTYGLDTLQKHWKSFPKTASIGKKTTELLHSNQIKVSLTAEKASTESLLSAAPFQSLADQTVVLVKGLGGRTLLSDTLRKRGAKLISLDVYKRSCPKTLPPSCKNIWKNKGRFIILGTSVESIKNLFTLFGPNGASWLQKMPWLVISERIKKQATLLGIKTIYVSDPHNLNESLFILKK